MRIHRHSINELTRDDAPAYSRDMWVHWRGFAHAYWGDEREIGDFGLELVARPPKPEASFELTVGNRGSETPFDVHATIAGTGFYANTSMGRSVAEFLSLKLFNRCRERYHRYESRQIRVAIHDGKLWWELWTHRNHWSRDEFAKWRSGNTMLNPLDRKWGERRYWYEDEQSVTFDIWLPDDNYEVTATLQRQLMGRPKAKRRYQSWVVDVDSKHGIPYCYDKSGGWKGDRVYGFAVPLRARREDWMVDAKAAIESYILARRAESGFRKALPVEAG